ncbi:C-type mannose receptor 2-like [Lineus longissimus]|uniref:C-type mannose receptor 2-like n=1 Tax=Lineus longissimus TaxID=88925 RepID=UPI002B4CAC42
MESCRRMLVLAVWGFLVSTALAAVQCPAGWTTYVAGSRCYQYVESSVDFATAENSCAANGGQLASVTSQEEHDFILSDIWPSVTNDYVYLGADDKAVEGTWVWKDGSVWSFDRWGVWNRQQLPVHGNVHNCLTMTKVTDINGDWYDFLCTNTAHFLCEQAATNVAFTCDANDGRNWQLLTDKCYFLVRGMKNWQRAETNCQRMGAQLASIHDQTVNDFFTTTWVQRYGRGMWVGLNDRSVDGTFMWNDGTTNNFQNWAVIKGVQQPENTNLKNCVGLASPAKGAAGQWNDYKCTMKEWSICQRDAV